MAELRSEYRARLLKSMHETLAFFDASAATLSRAYAPGKWTLQQVLVHLSDTQTVLLERLRRLASSENPSLLAFDPDAWADKLFYGSRELNVAKLQFEAATRSILELARTLPESTDARTGTHSQSGTRSFAQILEMSATHTEHHLEQARAIVAGQTWTPRK